MSLALPDVQGTRLEADARDIVTMLAPHEYQDAAIAAYEDAELLLTAILPDARIEHVGSSAVPGACSRGGVDIWVAAPRGAFDEALGVLCEAGSVRHALDDGGERRATLAAPHAPVALTLRLIESGSAQESPMRVRDALRADAALLSRYNAIRAAAAPRGPAAYASAKAEFFADLLRR
jgi:GrpB-like predicted nucleotidyltransferase (UPF0157 family)